MAVQRVNYDETFCGKLPLNQTNLIQPHGVVMLLAKDNFQIIQASENIVQLFKINVEAVVNTLLSIYVKEEVIQTIREKATQAFEGRLPLTVTLNKPENNQELFAQLHAKKDYLILEIELPQFVQGKHNTFSSVYQQIKYAMSAIDNAATLGAMCTVAANELKKLSGFDKVMIYSFDKDWNGTVLAEKMEEGMESYLDLRFPASDIPKPARDMYFKNPYRLIPNRDYTPVKLYPLLNPVTNSFSDLSDCSLRSVAAVHLEYIKNMGVSASMSTRIVYNGALWGLISCHHRTAKYLSFEACSVFELMSNVISAKINAFYSTRELIQKTDLYQLHTQMVEHIYESDNILSAFDEHKDILKSLLNADGVAVVWNGKVALWGSTPTAYEVENLVYWLQSSESVKTEHITSLAEKFEDAEAYAEKASGLLALAIQPEKGNFVLAFRQEVVQKISWGGNPDEAITFEKNSTVYHPRNSFSVWQETVRHIAMPWTKPEIEAAEHFRNFLIEYTLHKLS